MSRTEVKYRNELSTLLLDHGYNVFLPVFDEGIDLIAYRESDGDLKLVQQKSRFGIYRKYVGRRIWIAFRDKTDWYLALHDEMLKWPEVARYLQSRSWLEGGSYTVGYLSKGLRARCAPYRL